MPRQPKPFFRKQTQSWYFSTGGQQINLGKDKDAAFAKFHQMMADPATIATDNTTLYELSQTYLDWVQTNRKKATYDRSLHYLKSFIDRVGKQLKVTHLKPFHVNRWIDKPTWSSTSPGVQRAAPTRSALSNEISTGQWNKAICSAIRSQGCGSRRRSGGMCFTRTSNGNKSANMLKLPSMICSTSCTAPDVVRSRPARSRHASFSMTWSSFRPTNPRVRLNPA